VVRFLPLRLRRSRTIPAIPAIAKINCQRSFPASMPCSAGELLVDHPTPGPCHQCSSVVRFLVFRSRAITAMAKAARRKIRRASTCHPEKAAALAANEGPKSAKPSLPYPLPWYPTASQVIPVWREFKAHAAQFAGSRTIYRRTAAPDSASPCSGLGSSATLGLILLPKFAS